MFVLFIWFTYVVNCWLFDDFICCLLRLLLWLVCLVGSVAGLFWCYVLLSYAASLIICGLVYDCSLFMFAWWLCSLDLVGV